jgi:hypothetical protein
LILGLAIGITVGATVIGVAIFIVWKKIKADQVMMNNQRISDQSGFTENKVFGELPVIEKGKLENSNYQLGNWASHF